jgi:hypothetical protein
MNKRGKKMVINEQTKKYNVLDIAEYIVNVSYRYSWKPYYLSGEKLTKILQVIQMYFNKILHEEIFIDDVDDFVRNNKQYFCDVRLLLDENKNFDFIDDINKDIINLIIYDMKNLIGLEINENYILNVISSQPRR